VVSQHFLGHQGNVGWAEVRAADGGERHVGRRRNPSRVDRLPLPFPVFLRRLALGPIERGFWNLLDLFRVSLLTK
jgi:hypothetical protein